MRIRNDPLSRLNRFVFTFLMLLALSGGGVLSPLACAEPAPADPAQQLARLADGIDQYAKMVQPIGPAVDRTRFQTGAVVEKVGKDPAALLQWVRSNTRWIPYNGCLRGPGGVLMDRMGNSLDRALLLARLLQQAGLTVRLARGTLDKASATKLSSAASDPPGSAPAPASQEPAAHDQLIAQIAAAGGVSVEQVKDAIQKQDLQSQKDREQLIGAITDQSARLQQALAPILAGAAAHPATPTETDHWWVQYSAAGQWADADPQIADGKSPIAASETLDLPKDSLAPLADRKLLHGLTLRIKIEQSAPDGQHEIVAMEKAFPAAEFTGKAITLTILPLHWPGNLDLTASDAAQKVKDTLKAQHDWVPLLLINGQQWYQDGFDDHGVIEKHPSLDSLGQTGASVAKAGNAVLDVFGGSGNVDAPPARSNDQGALTAVWAEYEIDSPGQPPRTIRRDLYDFYGPAKRAAGLSNAQPTLDDNAIIKRSAALYQTADILPAGCVFSQDYVTARSVDELQRTAPMLSGALRQAVAGKTADAVKQLAGVQPLPITLMGLAALRHVPAGANNAVVDSLNVFTQRQGLTVKDDGSILGFKAIDIIANPTAITSTGGADRAFAAAMRQGVVDTSLEAALLGGLPIENVSAMYQASAAKDGAPWVLLKKGDDISKLKLSADSQARIASDLAAGYVVVAPQAPVVLGNRPCEGWWRIDPTTGNTLGIGATGMGDALAEEVMVLSAITGFFAFAGCGGIGAMQQGNTFKAVGCITCGVEVAVLTYFSFMGAVGSAGAMGVEAAGLKGAMAGNTLGNLCNLLSWQG